MPHADHGSTLAAIDPVRKTVTVLRNRATALRSSRRGQPASALRWLFLATLPNSGSTAFTRLLQTSPHVVTAEGRGEAQWLVPQLSVPRGRWDPDLPVDYPLVRAVWSRAAERRARRAHGAAGATDPGGAVPAIVLEKSPPNLVRMPALLDAFADTDPALVVFTRDPWAVCASWASRKSAEQLLAEWLPAGTPALRGDEDFHRTLGRLCGERMAMLDALRDRADAVVTYERFTDDTAAVVAGLGTLLPGLGPVDVDVQVRVKDYDAAPLTNMNEQQISRLSPQQRVWIEAGLRPFQEQIGRFGYTV